MHALIPIMLGRNGNPFEITNMISTGKTRSSSKCVAFSPDGLTLFTVPSSGATIVQYPLSTAWDVSSAGASAASITVANTGHIEFNSSGTTVYLFNIHTPDYLNYYHRLIAYTLPTPWSLVGAAYAGSGTDFFSSGTLSGFAWSSDYSKIYKVIGTGSVMQYSASGLNLSLVNTLNVTAQDSGASDVAFTSDGRVMFLAGTTSGKIYKYVLSTAWDLSTATYAGDSLVFSSPRDIEFSPDGSRLYLTNTSNVTTQYQN